MLFNLHKNRIRCHQITNGFAKLGGKVTTQTVAGTQTAGDNPDVVWLHPQLRKVAGPLYENSESAVGKYSEKKHLEIKLINKK